MTMTSPWSDALAQVHGSLRDTVLPVLGRLPAYGRLLYLLATDPSVPMREKRALWLALGYQVSPVDLVPGFIPVIGQLDDLFVLLWGIEHTLDALPPARAAEHLATLGLTRELIECDSDAVRQALHTLVARGTRGIRRGLWSLVRSGVMAGAFLGYLGYYFWRGRRAP